MTLLDWIRRPFVRLQLTSGNETVIQSVGLVEGYVFGKELKQPALFSVPDTVTGNVNVTYWNGTSEVIDAQFLSGRNMLIKKIDVASTTLTIDQIRLEV
jgi:hypothetical protein